MIPDVEEITKSLQDALYAISGMIVIAGVFVGILKREPLKIIIGSIPLVIVLIVLNGLIVGALVSILALMIIAYFVLVYIQPESEADHDGGGESQRNDPPTIDTLRGGQPVIVSASSAAPKVLDDVAGDVKPGKRKVILD